MQNDPTVGRVLLASLHQAVGEVLPARLDYYEQPLQPPDHPDEALRVSSFRAILDELQAEDDARSVFARAGQCAAIRSYENLRGVTRASLRALPRRIRARRTVRLLVRILPTIHPETRFDMTRRGGTVFIGIEGSPFCVEAERPTRPSCDFYSHFVATFLRLFELDPAVRVSRCRTSGTPSCLVTVLPQQRGGTSLESALLGLADDQMAPAGTTPDAAGGELIVSDPARAVLIVSDPARAVQPEPEPEPESEPLVATQADVQVELAAPAPERSVAAHHEATSDEPGPPPEAPASPPRLDREEIEARWEAIPLPEKRGKRPNGPGRR